MVLLTSTTETKKTGKTLKERRNTKNSHLFRSLTKTHQMRSLTMADILDTILSLKRRDLPDILKIRNLKEMDHQDAAVER